MIDYIFVALFWIFGLIVLVAAIKVSGIEL
jgi:hypothetical protein